MSQRLVAERDRMAYDALDGRGLLDALPLPLGLLLEVIRDPTREREQRQAGGDDLPLVAADKLLKPVAHARRPGLHHLVGQVALDVPGQAAGRLVPACAVLLQALHRDAV